MFEVVCDDDCVFVDYVWDVVCDVLLFVYGEEVVVVDFEDEGCGGDVV